jgi:hypothetical protein
MTHRNTTFTAVQQNRKHLNVHISCSDLYSRFVIYIEYSICCTLNASLLKWMWYIGISAGFTNSEIKDEMTNEYRTIKNMLPYYNLFSLLDYQHTGHFQHCNMIKVLTYWPSCQHKCTVGISDSWETCNWMKMHDI